jgi:hypothetical protein
VALALLALALALFAYGELLVRLRRAEPARPWWFGYARDGANLAASLMLWGAYLMLGWSGPVSLLAALTTTLAVYILDWALARAFQVRHPRILLAVPLAAWIVFIALRADTLSHAFTTLQSLGRVR